MFDITSNLRELQKFIIIKPIFTPEINLLSFSRVFSKIKNSILTKSEFEIPWVPSNYEPWPLSYPSTTKTE